MKQKAGLEDEKQRYEEQQHCGNFCGRQTKAEDKIKALEAQIQAKIAECDELRELYIGKKREIEVVDCKTRLKSLRKRIFGQELNDDEEIVTAFVVFRSMEGKKRVELAFMELNPVDRCLFNCKGKLCCDTKSTADDLAVLDRIPRVYQAQDPSLILWQNLGVSVKSKCLRKLTTLVISLAILMLVASINLYSANADEKIQSIYPQVDCDDSLTISQEAALKDFEKGDQQLGLMYCFCKQELYTSKKVTTLFSDGEMHCLEWF